MADWQVISGSVTAPRGYRAAGITAGLKPSGLPDLALIVSDVEAIAAGVFTTSVVRAAPIDYCRQRLLAKHSARAILCNAGQANAATGDQGWADAVESALLLAEALNIPAESILLASTGVIGQRIKMDALRAGIPKLVAAASETGGDAAAGAIINQITVDGDTSTNDTLIALANGQSRTPAITEMGADAEKLEAMLTEVCQYLARAIARDGEGATCLIEVQVTGAHTDEDARKVARTIAGSSLAKSAVFGRDPNWGRIAAAAGRAGVHFDQQDLRIQLGDFLLMENGQPLPFDRAAASNYLKTAAAGAYLKEDTVLIAVSIGNGSGSGKAWGCDLSYDYVKINAEYTT